MTKYSELIVILLLLPVVTQIIVPLLMLFGYSFLRVAQALFTAQDVPEDQKKRTAIEQELQVG